MPGTRESAAGLLKGELDIPNGDRRGQPEGGRLGNNPGLADKRRHRFRILPGAELRHSQQTLDALGKLGRRGSVLTAQIEFDVNLVRREVQTNAGIANLLHALRQSGQHGIGIGAASAAQAFRGLSGHGQVKPDLAAARERLVDLPAEFAFGLAGQKGGPGR